MNFKLKIWRQANSKTPGKLVDYEVRDISPNTSFLEMLDILNETLVKGGKEPIAFDSDCREGICGTCSLTINGEATRPRSSWRCVRALHEKVSRRRDDHSRAFSRRIVPARERSGNRSRRAGSHCASRWIHFRARRLRARGELDPGSQARCRSGDGSGSLHRVRRVRRGVSKWIGHAFRGCEGLAPVIPAAGPSGTRESRPANGQRDGCGRIRQLHQYVRMRGGLPSRD